MATRAGEVDRKHRTRNLAVAVPTPFVLSLSSVDLYWELWRRVSICPVQYRPVVPEFATNLVTNTFAGCFGSQQVDSAFRPSPRIVTVP